MPVIEFKRRLRWADADAAGRLHFPRIFEIVEEAESELMRQAGMPFDLRRRADYDFPRVNVNCNFLRIISLDEEFRLTFEVGRLGRTSITYRYHVFNAADELAVEGTMTVVVLKDRKATEIPAPLRAALET